MIKKMIALDWRAMKYYQARGLLLPLSAVLMGFAYSPLIVIPFLTIIGMSFSVNPFAVEEKGELNNLYLTLPIQRKQIVIGRYALSLLILLVSILIGIPAVPLTNLFSLFKCSINAEMFLLLIAVSLLLYSIFNIFTFPILFKLGYQKGKMWGFYLPTILLSAVICVTVLIALSHGPELQIFASIAVIANHIVLISICMIICAIALLTLSIMISFRVYAKRNF